MNEDDGYYPIKGTYDHTLSEMIDLRSVKLGICSKFTIIFHHTVCTYIYIYIYIPSMFIITLFY